MRKIDNDFIIEYQITCHNHLGKRSMGGTDELFAWRTAPSFYDILEITNPHSILQIGFNAGHSTLMFLMIKPEMIFDDVDLADNQTSRTFLSMAYPNWDLHLMDSKNIIRPVECLGFLDHYDMVFIDGAHDDEGVCNDIERSLIFKPEYVLLDDYRHRSHKIEKIVTEQYDDVLEVVKVYEFNDIWKGYSMALCKVKY